MHELQQAAFSSQTGCESNLPVLWTNFAERQLRHQSMEKLDPNMARGRQDWNLKLEPPAKAYCTPLFPSRDSLARTGMNLVSYALFGTFHQLSLGLQLKIPHLGLRSLLLSICIVQSHYGLCPYYGHPGTLPALRILFSNSAVFHHKGHNLHSTLLIQNAEGLTWHHKHLPLTKSVHLDVLLWAVWEQWPKIRSKMHYTKPVWFAPCHFHYFNQNQTKKIAEGYGIAWLTER